MKKPIPLPVKAVKVTALPGLQWSADVTFGVPSDSTHDDPTITVTSKTLDTPPRAGDVLMVRPPEIIRYARTDS